jgi:hypothetical protein
MLFKDGGLNGKRVLKAGTEVIDGGFLVKELSFS